LAPTAEQQPWTRFKVKFAEKAGALSNNKYRRYWLGSLGSVGAIQMATMAQGWLIVDKLGGSPLAIGFLGAATAIPTITVNLFGGVLADRVDRRKLIISVSAVSSLLLLLLAVLDSTDQIEIWHVVAIASVQGLVMGFDGPVRSSYFPLLIDRKHMMSAVALGSVMWQFSRLVTPIAGGFLIRYGGTESVFYVSVVGWVSMLLVMISLRVQSPPPYKTRNVIEDMVEGVKFVFSRRDFILLIGLTYASHFFGMQYMQLMPFFVQRLGLDEAGFGILFSVAGLGALTGTLVVGRVKSHPKIGYIMLGGSLTFTMAIAGFAYAPNFLIAVAFLYIAGLSNTIYFVVAMTVLQLRVPERMRGRVMGVYTITFSLIPLGAVMGGTVASLYDERIAVFLGASILATIFMIVGITQPIIRNIDGSKLVDS
jgi:MFS family permease